MRAMVFDRYGDPDVMRLRDVPIPEPQDGEILIRVAWRRILISAANPFTKHDHE